MKPISEFLKRSTARPRATVTPFKISSALDDAARISSAHLPNDRQGVQIIDRDLSLERAIINANSVIVIAENEQQASAQFSGAIEAVTAAGWKFNARVSGGYKATKVDNDAAMNSTNRVIDLASGAFIRFIPATARPDLFRGLRCEFHIWT